MFEVNNIDIKTMSSASKCRMDYFYAFMNTIKNVGKLKRNGGICVFCPNGTEKNNFVFGLFYSMRPVAFRKRDYLKSTCA